MPQLEGLRGDTEVIRTYYSFYISRYEIESRKDIKMEEMSRQFVRKGVVEICSNCTRQGYYIVGLESGEIIQAASPELNDMAPKSFDIPYSLILGLYVQRFATRLTTDELYYWSKQSSERILFEMNELESGTFANNPSAFESNSSTVSDSKVATPTLEKIKRMLEDNVISIPRGAEAEMLLRRGLYEVTGLSPTQLKTVPKTESKRTEYTIIRRPKLCSNQSC